MNIYMKNCMHTVKVNIVKGKQCPIIIIKYNISTTSSTNLITKSKILYNKEKYDPAHANSVKERVKHKCTIALHQRKNIDIIINHFQNKVQLGPQYVCCVCHRLLFKH